MADNELEMSDAEINEATRAIALQARALSQINQAVVLYHQIRQRGDALTKNNAALEKKLAEVKKGIEESESKHFDSIRRYEKERLQKEAQEKVKFEQTIADLGKEARAVAESLEQLRLQEADAVKRVRAAETSTEAKLQALDEQVEQRKMEVADELEKISEQLKVRLAEKAEVENYLAAIRGLTGNALATAEPNA